MYLIKKISVAIDGSEHVDKALDFALELAEKYSATVTRINVFQIPMVGYSGEPLAYPIALADFTKEVKVAHEKILSNALKRAKELKPHLKISAMLKEGRPADKIVEVAKEGNFDFIVMEHGELGKVEEFFLESVSDRVADEAHRPVFS